MGSPTKENTEALTVTDDTRDIETNRVNEQINIEEGATIITKKTYGNSWIVGSDSNGLVGTNTATVGTGQQVVGESLRFETFQSIVNPNNTFRERFRETTFRFGSSTSDWDILTGTNNFTSGEYAQSTSVALNDGTITKGKMFINISSGDISDLSLELTADGGSNWESVTNDTLHTFTNTGTDLRWKITATGTVTVTFVKVAYG